MTVRRPLVALLALGLAALGLAGCATQGNSAGGPTPSATPPPASVQPTPSQPTRATPSAQPADFTPNGLGPYVIGTRLTALQDQGLALEVEETPACPGIAVGKGTDTFQSPGLVFYQANLQYLSVASPLVPTSKGVRVGMAVGEIQKAYPDAITLNDSQGGMAMMVKAGNNALLFRVRTAGTIESIEAGVAEVLEFRYTEGEGC